MSLRHRIGTVLGIVGGIAAANHVVRERIEPLDAPFGGEQISYRWRGLDIQYSAIGDPDDQDVVLLHGLHPAGSAREFVHVVDDLAASSHVLVPDLPGFGCSDRPPLSYSRTLFESFLIDWIGDVAESPRCIASGLTAGLVAGEPIDSVQLDSLTLICPQSKVGTAGGKAINSLFRVPVIGTAGQNLLATRSGQRSFPGGFDIERLSAEDRQYFWQSAHQPGARYTTGALLAGRLDSETPLEQRLRDVEVPITLVWGRETTSPSLSSGRRIAEELDAKLVVIDRAGNAPHLEQPASFLEVISEA